MIKFGGIGDKILALPMADGCEGCGNVTVLNGLALVRGCALTGGLAKGTHESFSLCDNTVQRIGRDPHSARRFHQ
jgi:hypothetical protein